MRISTIMGTALLAGSLLLTGCHPAEGPSEQPPVPGTPPPATPHASGGEHGGEDGTPTSTDQEFAQQMLPHHQQAIQLSALAGQNASSTQVKELAVRIQKGQQPEIDQIKTWLTSTGGQHPGSAPQDSAEGHANMPGMVPAEKIQELGQLHGADFDRAWAQAMLTHHQGAVQMARTELEEGSAPDMRKLAEKIVATQQAEITELKALVG